MNKIISTEEEIDRLPDTGCYYRPRIYLSKYHFTKEILLDVFCSESLVCTYEDDWYNDLDIKMIEEYQPHINIDEFRVLWKDLDEILEVQQFCNFILNYPKYVVVHNYNKISQYINIPDITIFIEKILPALNDNKYIKKYNLDKNLEIISVINKKNIENLSNDLDYITDLKVEVFKILLTIPKKYSTILPL